MSQPKVLIGCPTYESYEYCIQDYLAAVKALTYKNYDLLFVDNSKTDSFAKKLQALGANVKRIPWHEDVKKRIEISRNMLREEVLENNYDYFFSLEQDVIPPQNTIEQLLKHEKDVVAGVYFYPFTTQIIDQKKKIKVVRDMLIPMVSKPHPANSNLMHPCTLQEVEGDHVFQIRGCGLGCVLIARKVLEKIAFRFQDRDDAQNFSNDCWEQGFKMYADTGVKCMHRIKNKPLWVKDLLNPKKASSQ